MRDACRNGTLGVLRSTAIFIIVFLSRSCATNLRSNVPPRSVIFGRQVNNPEISGGEIPAGDKPDEEPNNWANPGSAKGPYFPNAEKMKKEEAPELQRHAQLHVLEKEQNDQYEGNQLAQQGGIAPGGVLSDKNYLHDLLPMKDEEPPRTPVPFGKDAPLSHPFAKSTPPQPALWPESDEGPQPPGLTPRANAPVSAPSDAEEDALDDADEAANSQITDAEEDTLNNAKEDSNPGTKDAGGIEKNRQDFPVSSGSKNGASSPAAPEDGKNGGRRPPAALLPENSMRNEPENVDDGTRTPVDKQNTNQNAGSPHLDSTNVKPNTVPGYHQPHVRSRAGQKVENGRLNSRSSPRTSAEPSSTPSLPGKTSPILQNHNRANNSAETSSSAGNPAEAESVIPQGIGRLIEASKDAPLTPLQPSDLDFSDAPPLPPRGLKCHVDAAACSKSENEMTDEEALACVGVHKNGVVPSEDESQNKPCIQHGNADGHFTEI